MGNKLLQTTKYAPHIRAKDLLVFAAVFSALIAAAEGVIYYANINSVFFRILLILQNSIKAFAFRADISLKDAMKVFQDEPTTIKAVISYAYGAAVFIAPYCTVAAAFKLLMRLFALASFLHRGWFKPGRTRSIVLFGYNEDTKYILQHLDPDAYRVHLVTDAALSQEERYHLTRRGCRVHQFDCQSADSKTMVQMFPQVELQLADCVLLLEQSSVQNYAVFCAITQALKADWQGKVFFRCEDDGIRQLLQDRYEHLPPQQKVDLEVMSLAELQIREMYEACPLHSVYLRAPILPPEQWNVHLLILGFGRLGQETLLQAINLGVTHSCNRIHIDVVDRDMEKKQGLFASHFRTSAVTGCAQHLEITEGLADGTLAMDFHQMDLRYQAFQQLLQSMGKEPFTYVVVALEDPDVSIHCLSELRRYLGDRSVPIALRTDANLAAISQMEDSEGIFRDVRSIPTPADVWSFDMIFRDEMDAVAKSVHDTYDRISFGGTPTPWKELSLSKRDANRAQAYHQKVAQDVFRQYDIPTMQRALNALLTHRSGEWSYADPTMDDNAFACALSQSECLESARMEHRRWCYDHIAHGWEYSEKRDDLCLRHDCLLSWEALTKKRPDTCKYDLMPLMAELDFTEREGTC